MGFCLLVRTHGFIWIANTNRLMCFSNKSGEIKSYYRKTWEKHVNNLVLKTSTTSNIVLVYIYSKAHDNLLYFGFI